MPSIRRRGFKAKVMPIVKADVHAPIFCFPKNGQVAELETIQWAIKDAGDGR